MKLLEPNTHEYLEADLNLMKFMHDRTVTKRLIEAIDLNLMPKILEDISYILEEKWAERIPNISCKDLRGVKGFYHCHFLGEPGLTISGKLEDVERDLERIVSPSNVSLLYHTREYIGEEHKKPEHNILSSLTSKPHMVDPKQFLEKQSAVNFIDLGKTHYAQINFWTKGRLRRMLGSVFPMKPGHKLKNGTQLHAEAILTYYMMIKEILKIEPHYRDKYMKDAREKSKRMNRLFIQG